MKSIAAVALMMAVLSLCNLTEKTKETNTNSANNNNAGRKTDARLSRPDASSPEPDRVEVLVELMKIEQEVTNASIKGDISTLASHMADDYSGTSADGATQNKNQLLSSVKPDTLTKSWKITDGELMSLNGDSAVLTYVQSQTLKNGQTYSARVTDTFVKRDGRWLIKSEQQTLMK